MNYLSAIRTVRPLIECMTNTVSMNDVANMILAVGGAPCMAMDESELAEIVNLASAVVINFGTARQEEIPAFHRLLTEANRKCIPVVLDPVGAGASGFRTQLACELLQRHQITILRGNASEIRAITDKSGRTSGVDVNPQDVITEENCGSYAELTADIFARYHCITSISGAIDVIGDGKKLYFCHNGIPRMTQVTGMGCSLTGITAAFAAVSTDPLEAAAYATAAMGIAGEIAELRTAPQGLGAFHSAIIDALSLLDDATLQAKAQLKCCAINSHVMLN